MARIKLSREAAQKAIAYSNEAKEQLMTNVSVMDNNVNSQFSNLHDPAFRKYLDMSEEMQDMIKQIGAKMDEVANYCDSVIRWMDSYSEM